MQKALPKVLVAAIGLVTVFTQIACQTSRAKEVQEIRPGMNKGQVLGAVGGPDRTYRKHGPEQDQDEWIYVIHDDKQDNLKSVRFTEGRVTSVGDPVKPAISAQEQDKINEESNARAETEDHLEALKNKEATQKFFSGEGVENSSEVGAPITSSPAPDYVPLNEKSGSTQ